MSDKIIQLNEDLIKYDLKDLVRIFLICPGIVS